jgi:hypothetical protein
MPLSACAFAASLYDANKLSPPLLNSVILFF